MRNVSAIHGARPPGGVACVCRFQGGSPEGSPPAGEVTLTRKEEPKRGEETDATAEIHVLLGHVQALATGTILAL